MRLGKTNLEVNKNGFGALPIQRVELNEEQQNAVDTVINTDKTVCLLQGVTGSGKTEVYLQLVEHYIKNNQTAIVLVPEISLTPMVIQRFKERFKDIAVLHGSLSAKSASSLSGAAKACILMPP